MTLIIDLFHYFILYRSKYKRIILNGQNEEKSKICREAYYRLFRERINSIKNKFIYKRELKEKDNKAR